MPYKDAAARKAREAKYRAEHREKIRGYHKKWRDKNREKVIASSRARQPLVSAQRKERRKNDPTWAALERARTNVATKKRMTDSLKRKKIQEYKSAWVSANRNRAAELGRRERIRLRLQVIQHYDGECACCGENTLEFLGIDHANGGGREHKKSIPGGLIYRWLKRNGFPDGFQVLCHNCNLAKGFYGQCPHERERQWNAKSAS